MELISSFIGISSHLSQSADVKIFLIVCSQMTEMQECM